jgi:hypothetical protein
MSDEKPREVIRDLSVIEGILNESAQKLARLHDIRPHQFRLNLVTEMAKGRDLRVVPGPVVQIYVLWPNLAQVLRPRLMSAFALINTRKLIMPVEIVSYAYALEQKGAHKAWLREKFGDEAELLTNLVRKDSYRVAVKRVTSVTLTHKETGVSITLTDDQSAHVLEQQARVELSRQVRRLEDEQEARRVAERIEHVSRQDEERSWLESGRGGPWDGERADSHDRQNGHSVEARKGTALVPISEYVRVRFMSELAQRRILVQGL